MRTAVQETLPDVVLDFVRARSSCYLATCSADGEPYVQHRGGPVGFLVPVGGARLAFADYSGNRQYDTLRHLSGNPRAALILVDYPRRRRLKLWCDVEVVDGELPEALLHVVAASEGRRIERVLVLSVRYREFNCPQHIEPRWTAAELEQQRPVLRTVCLDVVDAEAYAAYRRAMEPTLHHYGGRFVLDVVGTVHQGAADFVANRVLQLEFPSRAVADAFYADPTYRAARERWFSVGVRQSAAEWR